jgi:hypothetical protein
MQLAIHNPPEKLKFCLTYGGGCDTLFRQAAQAGFSSARKTRRLTFGEF